MGTTITENIDFVAKGGMGYVEFTNDGLVVTVYVSTKWGSDTPEAQVNWSAIGSTDPKTAAKYASLINDAALWAVGFNAAQS